MTRRVTTGRRFITPATILIAVTLLGIVFALFAPQDSSDGGRPLSSYSVSLNGARGLYDVLQRLGYKVQHRTVSMAAPLDTTAIYMLLQPSIPLTAVELNELLKAVRHGATVVFTGGRGTLDDSLGFAIHPALDGFHTIANTVVVGGDTQGRRLHGVLAAVPITATITLQRAPHVSDTTFMWLVDSPTYGQNERKPTPARALVLGRTYGRGHAIGIATPDLVTNQLMRDGRPSIALVRALEWARDAQSGTRAHPVIFDEYHHGFGTHADVVGAVERALVTTPLGRMALQGCVAAVILILAVGARPLSPVSSSTFPRRSPLEHVGALAHAYLQVDARRLGAERLVQGLRRRHPLGVARSVPHEAYLATLGTRVPSAAPDVNVVTAAIARGPNQSHSFAAVGAAIANIERTFEGDGSHR